MRGGVCGIDAGGKRRKKFNNGLGSDLASFWYCANEPMVLIGHETKESVLVKLERSLVFWDRKAPRLT